MSQVKKKGNLNAEHLFSPLLFSPRLCLTAARFAAARFSAAHFSVACFAAACFAAARFVAAFFAAAVLDAACFAAAFALLPLHKLRSGLKGALRFGERPIWRRPTWRELVGAYRSIKVKVKELGLGSEG